MRLRRTLPAALLLLTPALAACGDDGDGPDADASSSPTEPTSDAPTTPSAITPSATPTSVTSAAPSSAPPAATLPAACDVVTSDAVARAYGVTVGPADDGSGATSEGGSAWKSDDCSFEAKDLVEITVKLTGRGDFTKGTFGCPQPNEVGAIVDPADDIAGATKGWWKVSDAPPLEATLRACTADALLDIELDYEDGVDYQGDPRNDSIAFAEQILADLQG
ncbi:hypothetical protein ACFJIY_12660 [Pimelobacter simplex]|uniref:hypothetical protein n=1 Tax=Nocardioides simplex TaxID=2045 RepID=UPI00366D82FC